MRRRVKNDVDTKLVLRGFAGRQASRPLQFLAFAMSADARWPGNFRDLNVVITRLGTLAPAGRITGDQVKTEVAHLRSI
jgi:sigma54-dependent transcription regulator